MTAKEKAALLYLVTTIGGAGILLFSIFWFPSQLRERLKAVEQPEMLKSGLLEDAIASQTLESVKKEVEEFNAELAESREKLESAAFKPRDSSAILEFCNEMDSLMAAPGIALSKMEYLDRENGRELTVMTFEAQFEADYPVFRKLLVELETHPAGIHIDLLEFTSFFNAHGFIQCKIRCSTRFAVKS